MKIIGAENKKYPEEIKSLNPLNCCGTKIIVSCPSRQELDQSLVKWQHDLNKPKDILESTQDILPRMFMCFCYRTN